MFSVTGGVEKNGWNESVEKLYLILKLIIVNDEPKTK